jgi:hypothetical protein
VEDLTALEENLLSALKNNHLVCFLLESVQKTNLSAEYNEVNLISGERDVCYLRRIQTITGNLPTENCSAARQTDLLIFLQVTTLAVHFPGTVTSFWVTVNAICDQGSGSLFLIVIHPAGSR